MRILNFKAFESYLESGRHLLYHTMASDYFFLKIIQKDMIEMKKCRPSRGPIGLCVSRNINWTNDGNNHLRIVLDSDLLLRHGIKSYPIQELAYPSPVKSGGRRVDTTPGYGYQTTNTVFMNVWKGDLEFAKSGKRMHPHNIDSLPQKRMMEVEFEERIFKDIKNLGKYIVYIDFTDEKDLSNPILSEYLKKYPHIKVRMMDRELPHIVKEVDAKKIIPSEIPIGLYSLKTTYGNP